MLFDLTWLSCGEVMRSDDDVVSTLVSPHMSQPTPVQYSTVPYSTSSTAPGQLPHLTGRAWLLCWIFEM